MSGFEKSRVVGMSDEDLEEFLCDICQQIFNNPVVTQCCLQMYCKSCIEEWLSHQNTCPHDRKLMTTSHITPAPRFALNLLNKLKIKCEFEERGCSLLTTIGDSYRHLEECDHKPEPNCKTCGLIKTVGEEHNCIESLVIQNNSVVEENSRLRKEVQHLRKTMTMVIILKKELA